MLLKFKTDFRVEPIVGGRECIVYWYYNDGSVDPWVYDGSFDHITKECEKVIMRERAKTADTLELNCQGTLVRRVSWLLY